MASAAGHRNPKCHVLNFFYDDSDGCALTILVNGVRFHIIADGQRLQTDDDFSNTLAEEYRNLLDAVKQQDQTFTEKPSKGNGRDSRDLDSQDSGHGTSEEDDEQDEQDSAVDFSESKSKSATSPVSQEGQLDPEKVLHNWMLSPFASVFDEMAPPTNMERKQTLEQWYDRATFFYNLEAHNGKLEASEEESTEDLERRMKDIVPRVTMPKYILNLDIPRYAAKDITVLDASDDPSPYHPSRVSTDKKTLFLKVVDPTQPQTTKREIDIMKRIEKLGLHKQMCVPLVEGLISHQDSRTDVIGFLQTEIEDPVPLTTMLDDDIPQKKRDKWARESERIVKLLHDHNIIWGDAKADNFMVDKHDNLWIIDFGGSYTDGWIDPELMETIEGDDMGVDKIVAALHDPAANTFDPDNEDQTLYQREASSTTSSPRGRKRNAQDIDDDDDDADNANDADEGSEDNDERVNDNATTQRHRKRVRIKEPTKSEPASGDESEGIRTDSSEGEDDSVINDAEQEQYCVCSKPSSGEMVACDNDDCKHQWFHLKCIGLEDPPESKYWYCSDCRT